MKHPSKARDPGPALSSYFPLDILQPTYVPPKACGLETEYSSMSWPESQSSRPIPILDEETSHLQKQ